MVFLLPMGSEVIMVEAESLVLASGSTSVSLAGQRQSGPCAQVPGGIGSHSF